MDTKDYLEKFGNDILYKMCKKAPSHKNDSEIIGKIWLIGRSYAASIERGSGTPAGENFYRTKVAPMIKKSEIDKWIESVKKIRRVTLENMHLVLEVHYNLTQLFKNITGLEKRSLASKYLHFHQPNAFFIFDSIANRNIRKELSKKKIRFTYPEGYDDAYSKFVVRCIYYRDNCLEPEYERKLTPREVDRNLLGH